MMIFGILGLLTIILNYGLLLTKHKNYFFPVGLLACIFWIIHGWIINDFTVYGVNIFMLIVTYIQIKQKTQIS